ncbi:MAG: type I restriction enzyme HsdR N-terminal domain-containing protein [Planctomycetota bacterium]
MPTLAEALDGVRQRIQRVGSKPMNEENTKATLIDPVLRALGWNTEDLEEVQREFRLKTRDKPVDYALFLLRNVRLFIEAKALGENLDDRRWANQIMGYATVAGVEWIVLTNGNEYRIYNAHAPVAVEEKMFRQVTVADGKTVMETLELLAKPRLEENRIDVLWRAHFVDRQVRAAIEELFSPQTNDMLLVNYVAGHTKNLTTEEIRSSIARCRLTLDFPVDLGLLAPAKARQKRGDVPVVPGVTLLDLIAAGIVRPPLRLVRAHKKNDLVAIVQPSGKVAVGKAEYDSPSMAAVAAIREATGAKRTANGWDFWQVEEGGRRVPLSTLRAQAAGSAKHAVAKKRERR